MSEQIRKIEEAVKYFNNWDNPEYVKTVYDTRQHLITLVDLAKQFPSAQEPREKEVPQSNTQFGFEDRIEAKAYNEGLKDSRLYHLKQGLGLKISAIKLAIMFHETYERLAPKFGYETKKETKVFNASSPNGKLMIEVCREMQDYIRVHLGEEKEKV